MKNGDTPLFAVVENSSFMSTELALEMMELFIKAGEDVNRVNEVRN